MKRIAILLALFQGGCGKSPTCDVSKLTLDMARETILQLCGTPAKINADNYSEQWVYDHDSYIYIKDNHFSFAQWVIYP